MERSVGGGGGRWDRGEDCRGIRTRLCRFEGSAMAKMLYNSSTFRRAVVRISASCSRASLAANWALSALARTALTSASAIASSPSSSSRNMPLRRRSRSRSLTSHFAFLACSTRAEMLEAELALLLLPRQRS